MRTIKFSMPYEIKYKESKQRNYRNYFCKKDVEINIKDVDESDVTEVMDIKDTSLYRSSELDERFSNIKESKLIVYNDKFYLKEASFDYLKDELNKEVFKNHRIFKYTPISSPKGHEMVYESDSRALSSKRVSIYNIKEHINDDGADLQQRINMNSEKLLIYKDDVYREVPEPYILKEDKKTVLRFEEGSLNESRLKYYSDKYYRADELIDEDFKSKVVIKNKEYFTVSPRKFADITYVMNIEYFFAGRHQNIRAHVWEILAILRDIRNINKDNLSQAYRDIMEKIFEIKFVEEDAYVYNIKHQLSNEYATSSGADHLNREFENEKVKYFERIDSLNDKIDEKHAWINRAGYLANNNSSTAGCREITDSYNLKKICNIIDVKYLDVKNKLSDTGRVFYLGNLECLAITHSPDRYPSSEDFTFIRESDIDAAKERVTSYFEYMKPKEERIRQLIENLEPNRDNALKM